MLQQHKTTLGKRLGMLIDNLFIFLSLDKSLKFMDAYTFEVFVFFSLLQLLEKLNTIRVSFSQHVMELPNFLVSSPNLEKLILDGCSILLEVHPSVGKLNKITILSLKNCKKLSSFPSIVDMKALEILNFSCCLELKKFPDIEGNVEHLLELVQL